MLGRFGKNVVSNAGGNAIVSVLQIVLLCVLFKTIDEGSYAAFLTAGYLIGLLEMASDYGCRIWATRSFSVSDSPGMVLAESLKTKLFYTLLCGAVFSLLPFNTLSATGFVLSVLIATTQPSTDPFLWFMRGKERLDIEAILVLSSRVAVVVGMILAALLHAGLITLLAIWLSGNVLRIAVECRLPIMRPLFASSGLSLKATDWKILKVVFPLGTAFVLTAVFQRASLYFVEGNASVSDYNIYATAFKFVTTSGAVATAIFVSSFARLSRAIDSGNDSETRTVIRQKMMLVTAVFVPAGILGILLMGPLSRQFDSTIVSQVAGVMILLLPALYLSCVNMGLKFTLNAYSLNWQDVGAVLAGILTLWIVMSFNYQLTWPAAGALSWFLGEVAVMAVRMALLRSQKKHAGVPVGIIFGSTVVLAALIAVR